MTEVTGELIKNIYDLYDRDDRVVVVNPLDYDFGFKVEGAEYIVRSGDQAEMLGYMANRFVKNVVDELMQQDKKLLLLNNKIERQKYVDKIVVEFTKSIAPVSAERQTGPTILKRYEKKGELSAATGGEVELPAVHTDVRELDRDQLDRLHPMDDGKGNRVQEEEFPTLKTRTDLMKEAKAKGIKVEATDTKESLTKKLEKAGE